MIEYIIIEHYDRTRLQHDVNICISNGWEPIGGGSVSILAESETKLDNYSQAMTRIKPE